MFRPQISDILTVTHAYTQTHRFIVESRGKVVQKRLSSKIIAHIAEGLASAFVITSRYTRRTSAMHNLMLRRHWMLSLRELWSPQEQLVHARDHVDNLISLSSTFLRCCLLNGSDAVLRLIVVLRRGR